MEKAAFSHVGLTCADPVRMEKFYVEHFGFKRARVYSPGPGQVVMIKAGEFYLELFKAAAAPPAPPAADSGPEYPGWRHICFLVDDLDAKLKELGSAVRITLGPKDLDALVPGMKACWVADPEGNIIELNQGYADAP